MASDSETTPVDAMRNRSKHFPPQIRAAHAKSIYHRDDILSSELCGCFYCLATFPAARIDVWTDHCDSVPHGRTALCPSCGIDAVLGSTSGFPITAKFLTEMQSYWFGTADDSD